VLLLLFFGEDTFFFVGDMDFIASLIAFRIMLMSRVWVRLKFLAMFSRLTGLTGLLDDGVGLLPFPGDLELLMFIVIK
jgi:hypothetical protein